MPFQVLVLISVLALGCAEKKYAKAGAWEGKTETSLSQDAQQECQGTMTSELCVTLSWEKEPLEGEFGSFLLQALRRQPQDQTLVAWDPAGEVAVELWMPSMGHGSSPVQVERLSKGSYRVTQVFFSMHGDWEIRIQWKDQGRVRDQVVIPVRY